MPEIGEKNQVYFLFLISHTLYRQSSSLILATIILSWVYCSDSQNGKRYLSALSIPFTNPCCTALFFWNVDLIMLLLCFLKLTGSSLLLEYNVIFPFSSLATPFPCILCTKTMLNFFQLLEQAMCFILLPDFTSVVSSLETVSPFLFSVPN